MKNTWIISRRQFLKASSSAALLLTTGAYWACNDPNKPILRIGLVTDTHYADREPAGVRYYRESIPKLQECVNLMNQEKVDLMVHIGDFKDEDPEPQEASTLQYVSDLEAVYAQFKGPRYHVLGNHDLDSINKDQFLERVENTGIDPTSSYYSFDQNGIHIIILDATFRQDGTAYDKGNFEWTDTFIPHEQLNWLQEDLAETNKLTLVFVHQLLDPEQTIEHQVKNAAKVRKILENSGRVLAVFQGHQHEGGYHLINNIHYYTLQAVVDHSGTENNSYAILEVKPTGDLVVNGYRRAEGREMGKI